MTSEQAQLYRAALTIGRSFGIGGRTWAYVAPVVNTPAASATPGSSATRYGYVVREKLVQPGQAAFAGPAPTDKWRWIGEAGQTFAEGGTLTSGAYVFRLGPVDTDQGYPTGIVERLA